MEEKKEIRKRILGLREEMDCLNWREKTAAIFHKVTAHPWFQEANTIYCYVDFRNEVGTADLMEKAWEMGKSVAVPKTDGERMDFTISVLCRRRLREISVSGSRIRGSAGWRMEKRGF